jgi:hypothetical protein
MTLIMADFDQTYSTYPTAVPKVAFTGPKCEPKDGCFPASHVTPQSKFLINTYLIRPDRSYNQPAGAVPIREGMLCRNT